MESPQSKYAKLVEEMLKEQEEQHRAARRELRDSVAVVIAVLAAIFAGWQAFEAHEARTDARNDAIIVRRESKEATEQARKDAQTAMQLQLDAAKASQAQAERSAKAAEASASVATLSLHISERAYVTVEAGLTSTPKAGEKLSFQAYVSNSGRTPALDVVSKFRSGFALASDTIEHARSVAFGANVPVQYTSKGIISPGGKVQSVWQTQDLLTQQVLDVLSNRQIVLYVFTEVNYKDEFSREHRTNYCAFFDPTAQGLLHCNRMNDAN